MIQMEVKIKLDNNGNPIIQEYTRCLRCGRKLKQEEYKKLGYGPICYEKVKKVKLTKLF